MRDRSSDSAHDATTNHQLIVLSMSITKLLQDMDFLIEYEPILERCVKVLALYGSIDGETHSSIQNWHLVQWRSGEHCVLCSFHQDIHFL